MLIRRRRQRARIDLRLQRVEGVQVHLRVGPGEDVRELQLLNVKRHQNAGHRPEQQDEPKGTETIEDRVTAEGSSLRLVAHGHRRAGLAGRVGRRRVGSRHGDPFVGEVCFGLVLANSS